MNICQLFKVSLFTVLTSASIVASAHNLPEWDQTQSAPSYSNNALQTVSAVGHALNSGATVNATVDLSQCTRQGGGEPSTTKGGLKVSPFRIQNDGTLSFADSHFTVSTSTQQPLMQFLRYTVAPEGGNITVSSYIFSVPDYSLISQVAFDCAINQGVNFYLSH